MELMMGQKYHLILEGVLIVLLLGMGIALGVIVFRQCRQARQTRAELARLREKNAALAELNEQIRSLAHHQRLETIGTLTASISHEFNNLLTPIMGYSMMALEKLPPEEEELSESLAEIYEASRKAKVIISRLSDLSRKSTPLSVQYVSPNELVAKTLEVTAPAKPEGVEVVTDLRCRHLWVYGNEIQLSQMLLNLTLNAMQAMEEGGGTLTLTTDADEKNIYFKVADTGPGIPEEALGKIFDPFFTTKESGKGTGLGLAIVQQVVEEHEGAITVESREGKGTMFTVRFPISRKEEEE